ncbi:MAG: FG-GAP-like repeat-containing protein [Planctomycetota bacterium]
MRSSAKILLAIIMLIPLVAILSWPAGTFSPSDLAKDETAGALTISDIRVSDITEHSATISWRTNLPADSQVVWRKDIAEEHASPHLRGLAADHVAALDGLRPGARYDFYVISQTADGRIASKQGPGLKTLGMSPFDNLCDQAVGKHLKRLPTMGTGIAWADFDNDGDLDVFIGCDRMFGVKLFQRQKRVFEDATALDPSRFGGNARSAAWADFDGDGDLDLLIGRRSQVALYANQGPPAWRFLDVSAILPPQQFYDVEGAGWIDYNNDGAIDIIATNGKYGILVFENQIEKQKRFSDAGKQAGFEPGGLGSGFGDYITIGDYDRDGRTDVLYNLLTGMLFRNEGALFARAAQSGVTYFCSSTRKLGAAFGDYDNDGDIDIFIPQRGQSRIFQNQGNGTFKDVINESGDLAKNLNASVGAWGDIDNDGDLDLYVGNEGASNVLYINLGNGKFENRTEQYGMAADEHGRARGMCFVDYDDDGDLDVYVHNYTAPDFFFENGLIAEANHNYLKVKFSPSPCPVGALISLYDESGKKLLAVREISGGEGWGSQPPPEAHFGVKPGAYRIQVRFTNGTTKDIEAAVTPTGGNVIQIK